jgi:hypothetical protein
MDDGDDVLFLRGGVIAMRLGQNRREPVVNNQRLLSRTAVSVSPAGKRGGAL